MAFYARHFLGPFWPPGEPTPAVVPGSVFQFNNGPRLNENEIYLIPEVVKRIWLRFGWDGDPFRVLIPDITVGDLKRRLHDGQPGRFPKLVLRHWDIRGNWENGRALRHSGERLVQTCLRERGEYEIVVSWLR